MNCFIVFLIWCVALSKSAPTSCTINPFVSTAPIPIQPNTTNLIYPEHGKTELTFSTNAKVELACPNGEVSANGISMGTIVLASCVASDTFRIEQKTVSWSQIQCTNVIKPIVIEATDISTINGPHSQCIDTKKANKIIQIGFRLDTKRFLNFVDICFSSITKIAVYSYFVVPASINSRAKNVKSPSFIQDDNIYKMGKSVHQLYKNAQTTINEILKLPSTSEKYVNKSIFPNRGHLAAKADFVYEPFQKGTYRYINVAPQWNTFNGGNWNQIETSVRNYADRYQLDLQIWCGVYGISVLPNEDDSTPENLYLYVDETDTKNSPSFPVVEVYWRLVYSSLTKKAIIIVGHNNPYNNDINKICSSDLSDVITWINWNRQNIRNGFSYVCDYNDDKFRKLVPELPKLAVNGLLD